MATTFNNDLANGAKLLYPQLVFATYESFLAYIIQGVETVSNNAGVNLAPDASFVDSWMAMTGLIGPNTADMMEKVIPSGMIVFLVTTTIAAALFLTSRRDSLDNGKLVSVTYVTYSLGPDQDSRLRSKFLADGACLYALGRFCQWIVVDYRTSPLNLRACHQVTACGDQLLNALYLVLELED